ncbi:hypothetical protein PCCS19_45870 [Paenibacillus sp. CCS19]|uniref:hypothetical protein n=1 Tax=Paenibacillus sp. CCS19 TaxID=3158387 RepID=UPI0025657B08|nr:hypothetical protein [Paenibacillus cellulosilyticus]GMK41530.1 hypothetical protein PCCS19_45870 [Paenibacillus cellulosilyticus]
MLKRMVELLAAPLLHAVLSIVFLSVLSTSMSSSAIIIWLLALLISNCVVTAFTADGRWYMFFFSLGLFLLLVSIAVILHIGMEDMGTGFMLPYLGLPITIGSLVLGTIQGILLSSLLREPIERLKAGFSHTESRNM